MTSRPAPPPISPPATTGTSAPAPPPPPPKPAAAAPVAAAPTPGSVAFPQVATVVASSYPTTLNTATSAPPKPPVTLSTPTPTPAIATTPLLSTSTSLIPSASPLRIDDPTYGYGYNYGYNYYAPTFTTPALSAVSLPKPTLVTPAEYVPLTYSAGTVTTAAAPLLTTLPYANAIRPTVLAPTAIQPTGIYGPSYYTPAPTTTYLTPVAAPAIAPRFAVLAAPAPTLTTGYIPAAYYGGLGGLYNAAPSVAYTPGWVGAAPVTGYKYPGFLGRGYAYPAGYGVAYSSPPPANAGYYAW